MVNKQEQKEGQQDSLSEASAFQETPATPTTSKPATKTPPAKSLAGKLRQLLKESTRYLIIGFSSAAIELVLFWILDVLLGFKTSIDIFGARLILSNTIAIVVATIYNYTLNRTWSFKPTKGLARSMILFIILFAFNNLFSGTVIFFLVGAGIYEMVAKLFTMACIVCWNFFLYRFVVFK